jgi:hypothetical protein
MATEIQTMMMDQREKERKGQRRERRKRGCSSRIVREEAR